MRNLVFVTAAAILGVGSVAYLACSGQDREVVVDGRTQRVPGSQTSEAKSHVPLDRVDHSTWDRLLKKYVDQDGMVNYTAWKASGCGSCMKLKNGAAPAAWITANRGVLSMKPSS